MNGFTIYRVIDNGTQVLTTTDSLTALQRLMKLMETYDVTWCWCEEERVEIPTEDQNAAPK